MRHLVAGYDLFTDRLYGHVVSRKGRTEFLAFAHYLRSLHSAQVPIAIVLDSFSPHLSTEIDSRVGDRSKANDVELAYVPFYASRLNRIEAQSPRCATSPSKAPTTPATTKASMIRRYIAWRDRHITDPRLRKVVTRAEAIERAKVA